MLPNHMGKRFRILLKFGAQEHMEDLRSEGAVFMKPLRYFQELEADKTRGDRFETSTGIMQPQHIDKVTISDAAGRTVVIDPRDMVGPIVFGLPDDAFLNVFCMYQIVRPTDLYPIDPRVQCFGPSFVMVKETQEFIRRLSNAAKIRGFSGKADEVGFFDELAFSGDTGVFRKSFEYRWQSEYRFVVKTGAADAIKLMLGNLSDIMTEPLPTKDIARLLDFNTAAARAAGLCWTE